MQTDIVKLKKHVVELVEIVSTWQRETIQRELRSITITQRITAPDNEVEQTRLSERKKLMTQADLFLNQNKNADFCQIAEWFDNHRETIEDADKLAVIAWKEHLTRNFPSQLYPGDMITIGISYFSEQYKYVGFLYWLVENEVTPTEIVNSFILHRYFEAYSFELELTYSLLQEFAVAGSATEQLLRYLETVPCSMHGLINLKKHNDSEQFFSRNVIDGNFTHDDKFKILDDVQNKELKLTVTDKIVKHAPELFNLFDWGFVGLLDLPLALLDEKTTTENLGNQVIHAVVSAHSEKISDELPTVFFDSVNLTISEISKMKLLFLILKEMGKNFCFQDTKHIKSLIDKSALYIHILPFLPLKIVENIPVDALWKNTLSHDFYRSIPQLLHLAHLCDFLKHHQLFSDTVHLMRIFLFDCLLTRDNMMEDKIVEKILELVDLSDLAEIKIKENYSVISNLVRQFIQKEVTYDVIELQWCQFSPGIEFMAGIDEQVKEKIPYPYTIFALKTLMLEKSWKDAQEKGMAFQCKVLAKIMYKENNMDDHDDHQERKEQSNLKRTLLESLLFSRDAAFIQYILKELHGLCASYNFLIEEFGGNKDLYEHALSKKNNILFSELLSFNFKQKQNIAYYMEYAWVYQNREAITLLNDKKYISREHINQVFLHRYINNTDKKTNFDDEIAFFLCQLHVKNNLVGPDHQHFKKLLVTAMQNNRSGLVWLLYPLRAEMFTESATLALVFACDTNNFKLLQDIIDRFIKNDVVSYFQAVKQYLTKLHVLSIEIRLLVSRTNDEDTMLHYFAKVHEPQLLSEYLDHLAAILSRSELRTFLYHKNDRGEIAESKNSKIQALIKEMRASVSDLSAAPEHTEREMKRERSSSPALFAPPLQVDDDDDIAVLYRSCL